MRELSTNKIMNNPIPCSCSSPNKNININTSTTYVTTRSFIFSSRTMRSRKSPHRQKSVSGLVDMMLLFFLDDKMFKRSTTLTGSSIGDASREMVLFGRGDFVVFGGWMAAEKRKELGCIAGLISEGNTNSGHTQNLPWLPLLLSVRLLAVLWPDRPSLLPKSVIWVWEDTVDLLPNGKALIRSSAMSFPMITSVR